MRIITIINNVLLSLVLCALMSACSSKSSLYVRSYPFDRKDLASYIVDTPDPSKLDPQFGQRLNIEWSIPKKTFQNESCVLVINTKYKNGEFSQETVPLHERSGRYLYTIAGKEYKKSGGIQSYFIELKSGTQVLAKSKHKLWASKVVVGSE